MSDESERAGLIRKAHALITEYAKGEKGIPLERLGVHPKNRGGQYPNGDTVRNLGKSILVSGFSEKEASHFGVCVEAPPMNASGDTAVAESFDAFNKRMS